MNMVDACFGLNYVTYEVITLYLSLTLRISSKCQTKAICSNAVRTHEMCLIQDVFFFRSYPPNI